MPSEQVQPDDAGQRLDIWLSTRHPERTRSRWQSLIRDGHVLVNSRPRKPHDLLRADDEVSWTIPPDRPVELVPEDIPLDILYEDPDILVINKQPDLVVHPAPGHEEGTLVHALLHHCGDLAGIGGELRPGIVHRLDRDTSGALVIAKNESALNALADQFKQRTVRKEYVAVVWGHPSPAQGTIRTLVGRSKHDRKKMSARPAAGREAVTHYETVSRFNHAALLRLRIETGRTHQIRVHLAHIGHPVVGDQQYGRARGKELPAPVARQMLHAERLAFTHPRSGMELEFVAPLPPDMRELLHALRET